MPEKLLTLTALGLAVIVFPMGLQQKRKLVPAFERVNGIRETGFVRQAQFLWMGPWFRGFYYSFVLAFAYVLPASWLEREGGPLGPFPSKSAFLREFARADVRRAVLFSGLASTWLCICILGYFLEVT